MEVESDSNSKYCYNRIIYYKAKGLAKVKYVVIIKKIVNREIEY